MQAVLRFAVFAGLVGASACASRGGQPATAEEQAARPVRHDMRRLAPDEIQEAQARNLGNLYALIETHRPQWLRGSAASIAGSRVSVWMDRVRLGGPESLRTVMLSVVESVRYLTPSEAQSELGLNNLGGAIVIYTSRR